MYKIYAGMSQRPQSLQRNPRALLNMKLTKSGYLESPSCHSINSLWDPAPGSHIQSHLFFLDNHVTKYLK
jgi:hypothetical protein